MKFTKIRLIGLFVVDLPVTGALPSDPYILKEADGLGPPEVDVFISQTLNLGGIYQGRRPQGREPVLKIGLNPDHGSGQSASDLRSDLYGLLSPGINDDIQLQIMNGEDVVAQTSGYVKRIEISPFSKDPEVQLTFECTKTYLEAPTVLFIDPGDPASPTVENAGTAPSYFHMEVIFTANTPNWTLTNALGKKMDFTYDFLVDDKLAFDTRPGYRSVVLTRDLIDTNILPSLSRDSVWHQFYRGENIFSTSSPAFTWGDVFYTPQFWGI